MCMSSCQSSTTDTLKGFTWQIRWEVEKKGWKVFSCKSVVDSFSFVQLSSRAGFSRAEGGILRIRSGGQLRIGSSSIRLPRWAGHIYRPSRQCPARARAVHTRRSRESWGGEGRAGGGMVTQSDDGTSTEAIGRSISRLQSCRKGSVGQHRRCREMFRPRPWHSQCLCWACLGIQPCC